MLAYMDPEQRRKFLSARTLEKFTSSTVTSITKLEAQLKKIRTDGYALNDREQNIGIVGIAVPILDEDGKILAALALHGPDQRLTSKSAIGFVPQMKAAADQLAKTWSY